MTVTTFRSRRPYNVTRAVLACQPESAPLRVPKTKTLLIFETTDQQEACKHRWQDSVSG
jgi:hypothetical protein